MGYKNKTLKSNKQGFTLIELLVVIAIIALLSSVALIAFMSARQKSRDAKRVGDMTQMATGMELYFNTQKGYPSAPSGIPTALKPNYASTLPASPLPADGGCDLIDYHSINASIPASTFASQYYYFPSGTVYIGFDGVSQVYPDYVYYFCLGNLTGNLSAGVHQVTPRGLR
jgi:prepilin-type N-terminal cleavage/methylation domain-containing protein